MVAIMSRVAGKTAESHEKRASMKCQFSSSAEHWHQQRGNVITCFKSLMMPHEVVQDVQLRCFHGMQACRCEVDLTEMKTAMQCV